MSRQHITPQPILLGAAGAAHRAHCWTHRICTQYKLTITASTTRTEHQIIMQSCNHHNLQSDTFNNACNHTICIQTHSTERSAAKAVLRNPLTHDLHLCLATKLDITIFPVGQRSVTSLVNQLCHYICLRSASIKKQTLH